MQAFLLKRITDLSKYQDITDKAQQTGKIMQVPLLEKILVCKSCAANLAIRASSSRMPSIWAQSQNIFLPVKLL